MTRDFSPQSSSDDSAVCSLTSCLTTSEKNVTTINSDSVSNNETTSDKTSRTQSDIISHQQKQAASSSASSTTSSTTLSTFQSKKSRPRQSRHAKQIISSSDLELAAKQMRTNNVSLISRSIRTVLNCFDDLDVSKFESRTDYLINFVSNGINRTFSSIHRPVSILWPDTYAKMVEQLSILDAFLLNTKFREDPVDWMLKRGLTTAPSCRQCNEKMTLRYEKNTVRWQCLKSQACSNYFMPVQRPSFFNSYESVGLDKLLFSIYYWATCTPNEDLYTRMNVEPDLLDGIWRRIQNVCRTALEKSYPRHRLTNYMDQDAPQLPQRPIDLISIKLNNLFVVCAKHPYSNLVRLGIYIPNVSQYNFVDLTESWFAHGVQIRVSESKFLDLSKRRADLKVDLVPRIEMISRKEAFDRDSAFGYLVCQLSHVFKDFESSAISRERIKLILAELQWRELYGTTPFDAFTNIVNHMAQYGELSDWYSEPSLPVEGEGTSDSKQEDLIGQSLDYNDYIWAEKYFYATVEPIGKDGNVISNFCEPVNLENPPHADVRIRCHECNNRFESFDFSMHMIAHVEHNRKEHERREYQKRSLIECKHCFKVFKREYITMHSTIFRYPLQLIQYGCRICCIRLNDRAQYLQHMRRVHFEHETPYRCPKCKYASSFQRECFIHFQEEHRHSMVILCPLCLRSFTVAQPKLMTDAKMNELSKIVYNHIAEHYVISKSYTCNNCCLCFLDKTKLREHQQLHHNPMEIRDLTKVKLSKFIVAKEEEKYCVKALPMELFIANKRPNLLPMKYNHDSQNHCKSSNRNNNDVICENDGLNDDKTTERPLRLKDGWNYENSDEEDKLISSDSDDSYVDDAKSSDSAGGAFLSHKEDGTIHVRGIHGAEKFLYGGEPALKITKTKANLNNDKINSNSNINSLEGSCTSQKLIDYLSKVKRADGIIPNQSVILTPKGKPAKCCECLQYVTIDHFVATIKCRKCKYCTMCPRAATTHNMTRHSSQRKNK